MYYADVVVERMAVARLRALRNFMMLIKINS